VAGENVYAAEATRGRILTVVTGTGVIQPRTKVNISSEIYGQIVDLPVKEGQRVKKGDLLVHINPDKYQSEADRLAANLRVSRIAIESEEVNLKNLEREQARAVDLHRQGILAISDKEHADLAVDTARIQIKSLKESVSQAEAALDRAMNDLTKTKVYAPMAGQITQVNTEVGEQVIVGTTNIPGSVLMVISDMGEVLAEVSVDETEVVRLAPGQKVKLTVDAVEKFTYDGRVSEIRNTAKREGDVNVFGVKILLTKPDERLRPGMTAKAKIEVARREGVLRIPIQAVTIRERKKLEEDRKATGKRVLATSPAKKGAQVKETAEAPVGGSGHPPAREVDAKKVAAASAKPGQTDEREEIEVVYLMEKGKTSGTVRSASVKTGASDESWVEIQDGLQPGDTVVTGPYRILKKLKDGDQVQKKEEKEPGESTRSEASQREGGGE
jgi:HlyD family secretion protein